MPPARGHQCPSGCGAKLHSVVVNCGLKPLIGGQVPTLRDLDSAAQLRQDSTRLANNVVAKLLSAACQLGGDPSESSVGCRHTPPSLGVSEPRTSSRNE